MNYTTFATNSNFLIPSFFATYVEDLRYFKLWTQLDQRFTPSGCKEKGIKKFELMEKDEFVSVGGGGIIYLFSLSTIVHR